MKQPPDPLCADCGLPLSADESWVCEDCCAFYEMTDPNGYGDDDE